MKRVLYLSILSLLVFAGCKDKTKDPDPVDPTNPAPTMNYVKFTITGPGFTNKTLTDSKAKNSIQDYTYSETTAGVIGAFLDIGSGDTLIQVRFNDNTTGNKPFSSGAVFFVFTNLNSSHSITATSTVGAYNVKTFTPTHLVANTTSGTLKGKFIIDATFSGTLVEDVTGDVYTITNGELKFDGE